MPSDDYIVGDRVAFDAGGAPVFVVSDLHLAEGLRADGTFDGTENFFADASFARFLDHLHQGLKGEQGVLVLNGDFIDFLRVRSVPESDGDFVAWQKMLERIGENTPSIEQLRTSVSDREKEFGFKTHAHKSVWRLMRVLVGHSVLFDALGSWLSRGHRLLLVKGNHDVELYWPQVRRALRECLSERCGKETGEQLRFVDHAVLIDNCIHIEHGHRFDRYSSVPPEKATLAGGQELCLPFGSFFNRYLLNRIELSYPYVDNVRPRENVLALLVRERFPLALELFFLHIPFLLRVLPKWQIRYVFGPFLTFALALLLPAAIVVGLEWQAMSEIIDKGASVRDSFVGEVLSPIVSGGLPLVLSWVFAQVVAAFHLREPEHLDRQGRALFSDDVQCVVMGHTHNPQQLRTERGWFFNSGTWIPIIETSSGEVRHDRTFTVVCLLQEEGRVTGDVCRWNDDAGRVDRLPLVRRV